MSEPQNGQNWEDLARPKRKAPLREPPEVPLPKINTLPPQMDNLFNACVPPPCGENKFTLMSPRSRQPDSEKVRKSRRTTGLTLSEWKQASQEDFL